MAAPPGPLTDAGEPTQPIFFLQIVDRQGQVARLTAGGKLEADLIQLLSDRILSSGYGLFKTEAHAKQALRRGITEAILSLKKQTVMVR